MKKIHESELILNEDGSLYHLNLLPEDIADTVLTVGDPDRVAQVSKHFDSIEIKKQKRELVTHTGYLNKKRLTVLSTGMSTDNIDIVLNELDAAVNINLKERTVNSELKSLNIIRIGTAGGLRADIPLNSVVVSDLAIGLDGLGSFYNLENTTEEILLKDNFNRHLGPSHPFTNFYVTKGSDYLINAFGQNTYKGITVTCGGFYGPQGRILRAQPAYPDLIDKLQTFSSDNHHVANFEMETAGLYALGSILGHRCCSVSAIIANRANLQFSNDPKKAVDSLIQTVLETVTNL